MVIKSTLVLLLYSLLLIASDARPIVQKPHSLSSLPLAINSTQNVGSCSFTVNIRTSCSSTKYTRDQISLSFGDAYGNQVYAPRLDDPSSRTFERCSADTFTIYGPCTYQICYLYLYRSGYDGWRPYDITVYGYNSRPVTFYYDVWMPSDIWYGFNYCTRRDNGATAAA